MSTLQNSLEVRVVIQRCTSAKLTLPHASTNSEDNVVSIGAGLVAFACFYQGATLDTARKMAHTLVSTRTCEATDDSQRPLSLFEMPGSLLLVPHFTLGGRLKGRQFQYHNVAQKDDAEQLFLCLVDHCATLLSEKSNESWSESGCVVRSGIFGARQVLSMETNGPWTHIIEW